MPSEWDKIAREAHQLRQRNQEYYDTHTVEPTIASDGTVCRSRLEALWLEEFLGCEAFECMECVQVPLLIDGPYGRFPSNYMPDLVVSNQDGRIFVELKPNRKLALDDDRQERALQLNPHYKFVVIGGYPYSKRGVTVRLLTGTDKKTYSDVPVETVLRLLGCA